ncbi:MAG TPA: hypothetical protein VN704_06225, partial [Verrucomicrobiae bacterium]|nr:hypothetical protein [Verrucomicrobiae bacterium]
MHNPPSKDNKNKKEKNSKNENYVDKELDLTDENKQFSLKKNIKHNFHFTEKNKINLDEIANTILFITVFVGIWQLIYLTGIWPKISLPSPLMVG